MDASEESVMQRVKREEKELSPAVAPVAAVTANVDGIKEEDKAAVTAAAATSAHHAAAAAAPAGVVAAAVAVAGDGGGGVAEEMENAGGSGSGAGGQAPPELARSPLAAAVAGLEDHVLECMVKVLMKKCYPPQDVYPMIGKSPIRPPWWPTGRERWWHELGAGAVPPPYRPARHLSKAEKEVAVVAMVKNIAPDYERLAMAMQMAPSVTSIITDVEARAWDTGVTRERDAYIRAHPRSAPPTRAWSLMGSLKPEAIRMKHKAPKRPVATKVGDAGDLLPRSAGPALATASAVPVAPAPVAAPATAVPAAPALATATAVLAPAASAPAIAVPAPAGAADPATIEAAIALIEAMKNSIKAPGAPYYPMPFPLLGRGSFEIIHNNEVDPNDDPENPIVWREYNRVAGELVLLRVARRNGGVVVFDDEQGGGGGNGSSGPRRGCLVMETNGSAQAYYRNLQNNGAPAVGAGTVKFEQGNGSSVAGGSTIYQNAGAGVKTEDEDEDSGLDSVAEAEASGIVSNKDSSAILQPNKDENPEVSNDPDNGGDLTTQESALAHQAVKSNDPKTGDDSNNNEVAPKKGTFYMLAGDDDNMSALDRWFENKYRSEQSNIPNILDEPDAEKDNRR